MSLLRIRQFWWKKFIKLIKEIKEFEKILLFLLFNLRPPIPSFHIVNMLCCGGHFSNIAFIDAKTQHRSPCILDVCLQTHVFYVETTWKRSFPSRFNVENTLWVCRVLGLTNNVFRTSEKDAFGTSLRDIVRTSVENVP